MGLFIPFLSFFSQASVSVIEVFFFFTVWGKVSSLLISIIVGVCFPSSGIKKLFKVVVDIKGPVAL